MKIPGVKLSLAEKEPTSLWVMAEFNPEKWQEIQKLTDNGINKFFNRYTDEYFSGNVFGDFVVWSPLVYGYKSYDGIQKTEYEKLPDSLKIVGGWFMENSALEFCFHLRNCLLFGYNTPFGGHFELKNSQNETIALQHNFYQSYDKNAQEYDLPPHDSAIEISVSNNLLTRLIDYDVYMSANLYNTRWGEDFDFEPIPISMATYQNPLTSGKNAWRIRKSWPGYTKSQKTL